MIRLVQAPDQALLAPTFPYDNPVKSTQLQIIVFLTLHNTPANYIDSFFVPNLLPNVYVFVFCIINRCMPVVTVEMYEGRTEKQKQKIVEDITEVMVNHVDASPETLHVIIHDVPKKNWGRDGKLGIYRED